MGDSAPLSAEEANWQFVRTTLSSVVEEQSRFLAAQTDRDRVRDALLIGRFDGIDGRLDAIAKRLEEQTKGLEKYNQVLDRGLALLDALNTIVAGVRSASDSTYDMAKSAALKIEKLRRFLNVPDAVFEPEAQAPAPAPSQAPSASDGSADPVRR